MHWNYKTSPASSVAYSSLCTCKHPVPVKSSLAHGQGLSASPRPEREPWIAAERDGNKVKQRRPLEVCQDLKGLSAKLCLDFVHCNSWTRHKKKSFLPRFKCPPFLLFTFSDLAAFLELIQFLCNKGNDVLNWIIGSFLQMSALPPTRPQTLNSPLRWSVQYTPFISWLWNKNLGIMLQFNSRDRVFILNVIKCQWQTCVSLYFVIECWRQKSDLMNSHELKTFRVIYLQLVPDREHESRCSCQTPLLYVTSSELLGPG